MDQALRAWGAAHERLRHRSADVVEGTHFTRTGGSLEPTANGPRTVPLDGGTGDASVKW